MRISILNIGNELLSGQCVDTNSAWLGLRLAENGFLVADKLTVGDEISDILQCMQFAAQRSDVILLTGGLGPTDDDLTRQAVAEYFGVPLDFSQELFDKMADYFRRRGIPMAGKNRVQAYIPAGATAIENTCGTAPGISASNQKLRVYAMPGVPSEMKAMFESFVLPQLKIGNAAGVTVCRKLKCIGIGESTLAEKLGQRMLRGRNPLINCTVSNSIITLYVIANAETEEAANQMDEKTIEELIADIGEYVFARGDSDLAETVGILLTRQGKKLATAESCTGGLIAKMLTDIPGSSDFYEYGWITYSYEAKQTQLGVSAETLASQGAVCEDVVRQMVQGAIARSGSDYAIAVSGIAGPGGGTPEKPVGLVYIAAGSKDRCVVEKKNFPSGREVCRTRTATAALDLLRREFLV